MFMGKEVICVYSNVVQVVGVASKAYRHQQKKTFFAIYHPKHIADAIDTYSVICNLICSAIKVIG